MAKRLGRRLAGVSALALANALPLAPVHAQVAAPNAPANPQARASDNSGIADIVVTATRREERLQDVPIAVTAFNSESLRALSTQTVGDLASITPNLSRTSGPTGGNDAFFFIRGIGQLDSNPANDPGVGVYIDGVYLGRLQGASLDTADVSRVEVLRGPQGTLFGRNTIGGAISITSRDPSHSFGVEGRITGGSRNRYDGFVSIDTPLSKELAIRTSVSTRNQDGWGKNVYTGKTFGDVHNLQFRSKAVWTPADQIKFTLSGDAMRGRGTSAHTILIGTAPATAPVGIVSPVSPCGTTPLGVPFPCDLLADTSTDIDKNFQSIAGRNRLDTSGVSGTVEWGDPKAFAVKAIVAYRKVGQHVENDFDGTGYRIYESFFDTHTHQLSGELQLLGKSFNERFDWLVGLYGYKEHIDNNNSICLGGNSGTPFPIRNAGSCLRNNQVFQLGIRSWAVFAHTQTHITPELTLIVGGRYTHEQKKQDFDFFLDNTGNVFNLFGIPPIILPTLSPRNPFLTVPTSYQGTWSEFTPKLGLNYKPTRDLLLYASYSRGFKSGGFNGRPSNNRSGGFDPILPYDPETLTAYEVGFKSDLMGRRLRLNGAAFYSIYDGIQLLVLDPANGFFNNANAGRNRITGFELELTARPVDSLTLYANVGYTHDKYTRIDPRAGVALNAHLPVTPKLNMAVGGNYRVDLGTSGKLDLRADFSHRSTVWYGATNEPLERQPGIGLLNLRATYTDPSNRYTVAAFGTNVTDKRYYSNVQDVRKVLGVAFAQVSPPAEWGIELGAKF